ncbi:MAG: type II methionyl aminopeptidase, partial [Nanoarchaeota archaeon]
MHEEEIKLLKLSGKITNKILNYGKKFIEPNKSDLELVNYLEEKINEEFEKIKDKGLVDGKADLRKAFPINISINEVAAHYTPFDKEYFFKEEDIIKLDLGISINGLISDSAITVYLGKDKEKQKIVEASKKALENVEKIIKKGIKNNEIGEIIEKTIKEFNLNPIYNLGGHSIEKYNLHSGIFIPNYNNKEGKELREGIYAIEPFATNGIGEVKNWSFSNIVILNQTRARIPLIVRKNYQLLLGKFKTLPFSLLDIKNKLSWDKKKIKMVLNQLERFGLIYKYPILVERSNGLVSQHEHTFLILEDK